MKLFLDTETTGVPKNYKAPISDYLNWPRLVQLGYILFDNGQILYSNESIIKPNGFLIPVEASNVHRITTEKALAEGLGLFFVLEELEYWLKNSDTVIGHNVAFDVNVIGCEYWRLGGLFEKNPLEGKKTICTMLSGIEFCQLPGKYPGKLKYPKLSELYSSLFLKPMSQTHTALDDISHTVECYQAMVERGIIKE